MPEPLRILHVVGDSKYGGGSVVVQRLAEFARRQGFDVDVLTTDRIFQGILRGNGIGVVDLPCIWRDTRPRDAVGLWRLVTFLQKNRYTIVHTHTSKGGFIGRLAARLAHVPVVIHTVHGFAFHEQSKPYQILLFGTLERLAAKWCDAIVTVSEFHRDWALRLGIGTPQQVFAIPNGIPPNRVYPTQPRDITRAELGVGEGEYLLISIGRLAPQKGFEYALSALQLLRPSLGQAIRLVIAGEGPMRSALENMIRRMSLETSVSLIGFREDVGNLLAAADAVILPSLWEGLSISLLETMAAGKPIITTDIGSNREVLAQEQAALLVPAADAAALANAIARLMRDPGLANELGRRAREVYERHYTEDRMLRQYHEVYAMLVRRKLGYSGLLTVDEATTRRKGDAGLPDSFALRLTPAVTDGGPPSRAESRTPGASGLYEAFTIRPAHGHDVGAIVAVHLRAFPGFLMTRLGPSFLEEYYGLVLNDPTEISLVAEAASRVIGFVVGYLNPKDFYQALRARKIRLATCMIPAVLRDPRLIPRVLASFRRTDPAAIDDRFGLSELASVAVDPTYSGQGIGTRLVRSFIDEARRRGALGVYLTTDADDNDAVNRFYVKFGFSCVRTFQAARNRMMNEYRLVFEGGMKG